MTPQTRPLGLWTRLADRHAIWAAGRLRLPPGFLSPPEPHAIGLFGRGKQILAGELQLGGQQIHAPDRLLWDVSGQEHDFTQEAHGFGWLDDLAALGTPAARKLARDWTQAWINRYGQGRGGPASGWSPALCGRRVTRWVQHGEFLLAGSTEAERQSFFTCLSRQTGFLARRAKTASAGLARIEAWVGLLHAGLSLQGALPLAERASAALTLAGAEEIQADGAIASRNPEELLSLLTLLVWALRVLAKAEQPIPNALSDAVDRIAPALRLLRHADGGLTRLHGGGHGAEGRLEQALTASAVLPAPGHLGFAMGYARLSGGRTTVIVDAAAPPSGAAALSAHASTAAFELTSGRRPLIVSCGAGNSFGPGWHLAGRATQSHSALSVTGTSSSRFGREDSLALDDQAAITALYHEADDAALLQLAHDGWVESHGLTAWRELTLSNNGRHLTGLDALVTLHKADEQRFAQALQRLAPQGVPFTLRFHLHPDVDATLDMRGTAVSMQLRSGEIWVFRHDGLARLSLEPSFYLQKGRAAPRASLQIVLSHHALDIETRIGWTLAKAQDTPLAIRDLDRDEPVPI